jgi:nucleoside-diphosphate-sugar epimerase
VGDPPQREVTSAGRSNHKDGAPDVEERKGRGSQTRPIDEFVDVPPDTPYGRSKREAEELVLNGGYVPHPVVLRPSLVYGPGVLGNLEKMMEAVRRGRFPPLPETGNKRSMVHIDDLIAAAILAAHKPEAVGRTYIVADNAPCSTRDLFVWMSEAVGRSVPGWTIPLWLLRAMAVVGDGIGKIRGRRFVFDSPGLDRLTSDSWYSSARIQKELGWSPERTIRGSLKEMAGVADGMSPEASTR